MTLCTLGPLTNIGLALQKAPDIAPRVKELVMMGGGFLRGRQYYARRRIQHLCRPARRSRVFASGIPITMMPLDVTHQLMTTKARVARIAAIGTKPADAIGSGSNSLNASTRKNTVLMAARCMIRRSLLISPEAGAVHGRRCNVEIELQSELTIGMTVVDWWRVSGREPNATVMRNVDADGFFDLLVERFARNPMKRKGGAAESRAPTCFERVVRLRILPNCRRLARPLRPKPPCAVPAYRPAPSGSKSA